MVVLHALYYHSILLFKLRISLLSVSNTRQWRAWRKVIYESGHHHFPYFLHKDSNHQYPASPSQLNRISSTKFMSIYSIYLLRHSHTIPSNAQSQSMINRQNFPTNQPPHPYSSAPLPQELVESLLPSPVSCPQQQTRALWFQPQSNYSQELSFPSFS